MAQTHPYNQAGSSGVISPKIFPQHSHISDRAVSHNQNLLRRAHYSTRADNAKNIEPADRQIITAKFDFLLAQTPERRRDKACHGKWLKFLMEKLDHLDLAKCAELEVRNISKIEKIQVTPGPDQRLYCPPPVVPAQTASVSATTTTSTSVSGQHEEVEMGKTTSSSHQITSTTSGRLGEKGIGSTNSAGKQSSTHAQEWHTYEIVITYSDPEREEAARMKRAQREEAARAEREQEPSSDAGEGLAGGGNMHHFLRGREADEAREDEAEEGGNEITLGIWPVDTLTLVTNDEKWFLFSATKESQDQQMTPTTTSGSRTVPAQRKILYETGFNLDTFEREISENGNVFTHLLFFSKEARELYLILRQLHLLGAHLEPYILKHLKSSRPGVSGGENGLQKRLRDAMDSDSVPLVLRQSAAVLCSRWRQHAESLSVPERELQPKLGALEERRPAVLLEHALYEHIGVNKKKRHEEYWRLGDRIFRQLELTENFRMRIAGSLKPKHEEVDSIAAKLMSIDHGRKKDYNFRESRVERVTIYDLNESDEEVEVQQNLSLRQRRKMHSPFSSDSEDGGPLAGPPLKRQKGGVLGAVVSSTSSGVVGGGGPMGALGGGTTSASRKRNDVVAVDVAPNDDIKNDKRETMSLEEVVIVGKEEVESNSLLQLKEIADQQMIAAAAEQSEEAAAIAGNGEWRNCSQAARSSSSSADKIRLEFPFPSLAAAPSAATSAQMSVSVPEDQEGNCPRSTSSSSAATVPAQQQTATPGNIAGAREDELHLLSAPGEPKDQGNASSSAARGSSSSSSSAVSSSGSNDKLHSGAGARGGGVAMKQAAAKTAKIAGSRVPRGNKHSKKTSSVGAVAVAEQEEEGSVEQASDKPKEEEGSGKVLTNSKNAKGKPKKGGAGAADGGSGCIKAAGDAGAGAPSSAAGGRNGCDEEGEKDAGPGSKSSKMKKATASSSSASSSTPKIGGSSSCSGPKSTSSSKAAATRRAQSNSNKQASATSKKGGQQVDTENCGVGKNKKQAGGAVKKVPSTSKKAPALKPEEKKSATTTKNSGAAGKKTK